MNKNERKKILIPHMCGKNLVIDEKFINLSLLKPKDLMKNPLRVHEPLSVERKLMRGIGDINIGGTAE